MTYTVVHKEYTGRDLHEAAGAMLKDPEVWEQRGGPLAVLLPGREDEDPDVRSGDQKGYALDHWECRQAADGNGVILSAYFR